MTNALYESTDHDRTEEELAPWLAPCGTGDLKKTCPALQDGGGRGPGLRDA